MLTNVIRLRVPAPYLRPKISTQENTTIPHPFDFPSPGCYSKRHNVGNCSVMAALDAGCARTSRPHWYAYALVKGRLGYENVFTPLSFFPFFPFFPFSSFALSFFLPLYFFTKFFLSFTYHNQFWFSSLHNTKFVSPLKPFHSAA